MSGDARFALIIAVNAYDSSDLDDLSAPHRDAAILAEVLERPDVGAFQSAEVVLDPDNATAMQRIEDFFNARDPLDIAVLHFSGHGFRGRQPGELFLGTRNVDPFNPFSTAVSADFLRSVIEQSPARRKLVLLDCCHSGAFQLSRGPAAPGTPDRARTAEILSDGLRRITPAAPGPESNATGTVVIGAARATEASFETRNGALTEAIVHGLSTGAADINRTGRISTENLFEYVTRWFREHDLQQHPVVQQKSRSGQFIIANNCDYRPVDLPPEIEDRLLDTAARRRAEAVHRLYLLVTGREHDVAEAAYLRLKQVADFDLDDEVSGTAQVALARLVPTFDTDRIDLGTVDQDSRAEPRTVAVTAPRFAHDWSVHVPEDAPIEVTRHPGHVELRLDTSQPRPRFYTSVTVQAKTGAAQVPLTARVRKTADDRAPWDWRRLAFVPLMILVLLAVTSVRWMPSALVAGPCVPPDDLRVLTTESLRDAIDAAAAGFSAPADGAECGDVRVTVTAVTSDGVAQERFAAQWPDDDLRIAGPSPDVWLPESSLRVALARDAIPADAPHRLELPADPAAASVASSPLVLAAPETAAVAGPLTAGAIVDGDWVLPRADPRTSTAGLLATVALYGQEQGSRAAEQTLQRGQGGDDARYDLCAYRSSTDPPPLETAFLVPQKYVTDYRTGKPLGAACQAEESPPLNRGLRAVPVTGAPALDVPCVPIQDTAWGDRTQWEIAGEFCDYLRGEGGAILRDHGLGPPVEPSGEDGVARAVQVLDDWTEEQRPVRILLVMDVSGSMRLPMPGAAGTTRIDAARTAAARAVTGRLLTEQDEIGLWEFATRLDGNRDYRELLPLGPAAGDQQSRLTAELTDLAATRADTGLYDTISAGIDRLRARPAGDLAPINVLVVLTDGENDDSRSAGPDDIAAKLAGDGAEVNVAVIASVGANCRTFQPLLSRGLGCFDANRDGLDAAFDKALPSRRSDA